VPFSDAPVGPVSIVSVMVAGAEAPAPLTAANWNVSVPK